MIRKILSRFSSRKAPVQPLANIPLAGTARQFAMGGIALTLIMASAFGVIRSTHNCRELYAQLQVLEASQWYLQEDYGRLLLEQSTWASHYRVEQVAQRELQMHAPDATLRRVVVQ